MISLEVQKNPMFLQLLRLQWKSYRRSAAFTSGVLTSVFYLFGMLYFIGIFTLLGYGSFFLIDQEMGVEPLSFVNKYMIYGTSFWVVWRYFIQKMPVLNIQALLTLPIKENTIVHYALGRTIFSFFNVSNLSVTGNSGYSSAIFFVGLKKIPWSASVNILMSL